MTTGVRWEWHKTENGTEDNPIDCSASPTFGTDAIAKTATYTPKAADRYQCLQAIATYTDPYGSDTTMDVSTNAVVDDLSNRAPQFKDGDVEITAKTIRVNENIKRDDDVSPPELGYVGVPVKATDPNAADILTYTLSGADADKFDIISENDVDTADLDEEGQIRLKAGTKLNYESNKKTYMVTVTARDPLERRRLHRRDHQKSSTSMNPRSSPHPARVTLTRQSRKIREA